MGKTRVKRDCRFGQGGRDQNFWGDTECLKPPRARSQLRCLYTWPREMRSSAIPNKDDYGAHAKEH